MPPAQQLARGSSGQAEPAAPRWPCEQPGLRRCGVRQLALPPQPWLPRRPRRHEGSKACGVTSMDCMAGHARVLHGSLLCGL